MNVKIFILAIAFTILILGCKNDQPSEPPQSSLRNFVSQPIAPSTSTAPPVEYDPKNDPIREKLAVYVFLQIAYVTTPSYHGYGRPEVPKLTRFVSDIKKVYGTLSEEEEYKLLDDMERRCYIYSSTGETSVMSRHVSYFSSYKEASDSIHKISYTQRCRFAY